MRDLAYDLAENAAEVKYDDLPKNVVEITKKFILDTLATTIAGSSAPGCRTVVEHFKDWGGKEEGTILVYGGKVISANAALCNSMMAHALEFDDSHDEAMLHANISVLPAVLAMAERRSNVGGKEVITAVAVGVDLIIRLGLAVPFSDIWILSSTAGYFGATVAAGKILGLDKDKLLNAMGIAYSQCAGTGQASTDGGLVKRMQPGFAARGAVLSCLLAQRGITGAKNIFEGQRGFFLAYYSGRYDRRKVIEGLGKRFEGESLSVKPYPCCRYAHASIDATLNIVEENDIGPDDVAEVVAHVTQETYLSTGRPFKIREYPQVDAQFSIPYTVAVAIARKNVFIDDFSEQKIISGTQVLELAKRVRVIADQEPIGKGFTPCIVDIRTKDGKVYSHRVEIIRGNPQKPIGMEEITQKFRKCVAFSAKPISNRNAERIITLVKNLENIPDVSEVIMLAA